VRYQEERKMQEERAQVIALSGPRAWAGALQGRLPVAAARTGHRVHSLVGAACSLQNPKPRRTLHSRTTEGMHLRWAVPLLPAQQLQPPM
jgi:hypothetical protein